MDATIAEDLKVMAVRLMEHVIALNAAPITPSLLTFERAAEALAVSKTTIQELVDSGELPVVSVTGRAVRVDTRDIDAYIKRKRSRRG